MNNLFEFTEDYDIVIDPQALTLVPFKAIYDKYTSKKVAIAELSYIVFLCNPKSDYSDIRDLEERSKVILESIVYGKDIKIDSITEKAIEFYKERNNTTTTKFLENALDAIDKISKYLKFIDFNERDAKGNIVNDPKKVVDVIAATPKLMEGLRIAQEAVKKEQEMEKGIRGSGQKGIYEDGNLN
jgi:hypothetical protein